MTDWRNRLPWPEAETHKHARGRLGVVSGTLHRTGAARLTARAGLRIGAGLVKVMCPPESLGVLAPVLEAPLLEVFDGPTALARAVEGFDAVVIGPAAGRDEHTFDNLHALAETGCVLIVDADALSLFEGRPEALFAVLDRDDVITPHAAEFSRLFPDLGEQPREAAAREAAHRADAVVVLKGAATVIAAPDGRVAVNDNGTPWLATAGTGDVLAGMIGGLVAQRMDSFDAACAAVWIHAEVARRFGPGLIAEDIADGLPPVLNALAPEGL